jgi:ABC-type transporter Mla subunit MlaD
MSTNPLHTRNRRIVWIAAAVVVALVIGVLLIAYSGGGGGGGGGFHYALIALSADRLGGLTQLRGRRRAAAARG